MNHQRTAARSRALTARQKEILGTALAQGYFEFPRRLSLTGLSQLVGVKPSTLSEILRGAERKALEGIVRAPAQRKPSKVN
ncbi:MAG TPA: helix-turn-helix domain-containing protein [Nitrososphaerales archaeon]|nr:helix-turn-helix domain-containing protein [Nitrososphaerales archaeon]HUK80505.1 helix-turn-helix domain-containing protein [Nitrososphaerales archaeon]